MSDPTPEELAELETIRASKAAAEQKETFFSMMDEWADKRLKAQPKPKTPAIQRPPSFLEGLFGSVPTPKKDEKTA